MVVVLIVVVIVLLLVKGGMLFEYNVSMNYTELIHYFFFLASLGQTHIDGENQTSLSNIIIILEHYGVVSIFIFFFHLFPLFFGRMK
jgi:hypothetical protein